MEQKIGVSPILSYSRRGYMPMSISASRPHGFLLFLLKLPVHIYRLKMGWVLGHRFLMLTHRGRKSGKVRQTVLEVVAYDRARRESFVASGWGTTTDWYRNIEAAPALAIQTGTARYRPVQHFLSQDENLQALMMFKRKHPFEVRLALRLFGVEGKGTLDERIANFAGSVNMVSFRPRKAASPE